MKDKFLYVLMYQFPLIFCTFLVAVNMCAVMWVSPITGTENCMCSNLNHLQDMRVTAQDYIVFLTVLVFDCVQSLIYNTCTYSYYTTTFLTQYCMFFFFQFHWKCRSHQIRVRLVLESPNSSCVKVSLTNCHDSSFYFFRLRICTNIHVTEKFWLSIYSVIPSYVLCFCCPLWR